LKVISPYVIFVYCRLFPRLFLTILSNYSYDYWWILDVLLLSLKPIKLARRYTRNKYIIIATNSAIKSVEVRTLITNITTITTIFLYECILTRFKGPLTIFTD
jgi:1,4-dihydroxy-2-naphthoate octaprenyltransferase